MYFYSALASPTVTFFQPKCNDLMKLHLHILFSYHLHKFNLPCPYRNHDKSSNKPRNDLITSTFNHAAKVSNHIPKIAKPWQGTIDWLAEWRCDIYRRHCGDIVKCDRAVLLRS